MVTFDKRHNTCFESAVYPYGVGLRMVRGSMRVVSSNFSQVVVHYLVFKLCSVVGMEHFGRAVTQDDPFFKFCMDCFSVSFSDRDTLYPSGK